MISAIILAAGESKRMGQPKMLLAWNTTTVLGQVISTFREGGVTDIVVVTGGGRQHVERIARQHNARSIFNPDFASGEMLSSLQIGLKAQTPETRATLIGLGDQPQIQVETVLLLCEIFREREAKLIAKLPETTRSSMVGEALTVERFASDEIPANRARFFECTLARYPLRGCGYSNSACRSGYAGRLQKIAALS
jgi:molybdenum cofactor cytidylyltransferase